MSEKTRTVVLEMMFSTDMGWLDLMDAAAEAGRSFTGESGSFHEDDMEIEDRWYVYHNMLAGSVFMDAYNDVHKALVGLLKAIRGQGWDQSRCVEDAIDSASKVVSHPVEDRMWIEDLTLEEMEYVRQVVRKLMRKREELIRPDLAARLRAKEEA